MTAARRIRRRSKGLGETNLKREINFGLGLTRAPLGAGESHILLGAGVSFPVISQTTGPISKIQTPFDSPVREISKQCAKFDLKVTDDVTSQVKFEKFDFVDFMILASKILILDAKKANESTWIVSLIFVRIISCAL